MKKTMIIEGMMCSHCSGRVQNALENVDGVEKVDIDLEKKEAVICLKSSISDDVLRKAVLDAGYKVISVE